VFPFFSYRPRLWLVLLVSNLALVLLPIIGIVLSGVIQTQQVRSLDRELRLQAAHWAAVYRAEALFLQDSSEWLRDYPITEGIEGKSYKSTTGAVGGDSIQEWGRMHYQDYGIKEERILPESGNFGEYVRSYTDLLRAYNDFISVAPNTVNWVFGTRLAALEPRILSSKKSLIHPKLSCQENNVLGEDDLARSIGRSMQLFLNSWPKDGTVIQILDRKGFVVASSGVERCHRILMEDQPPLKRAWEGVPQASLHRNEKTESPLWTMLINQWETRDVVVSVPVIAGNRKTGDNHILAIVVLSGAPTSLFELVMSPGNKTERRWFVFILAISLLIATGIVVLSITRPFQAVHAQMKRATDGERGVVEPVRHTVTREIQDLSRGIASMVKILERREQQTRDLAFHVAHETRNPLTSTLGSIDLLRKHAEKMSEEDRERFLSIIEKDAKRLAAMTDRLMDLAQAERVVVDESNQVIVEEVLRNLEQDSESPTFSLHVNSKAEGKSVAIEAEWLNSIITSLIENAHQHGGEDVKVTIKVDVARNKERSLLIQVHNEGKTILPANREKIFDPFFTTTRDRSRGGFGLSIVKALVEAHKGTIDLIDAGSGTTFEIVLPIG